MKKWILELILTIVVIVLLVIGTKYFTFENITITTLGMLVAKTMATDIWNFKK